MPKNIIPKPKLEDLKIKPNITNYEDLIEGFTWDQIKGEIDGLEGGGLNIAYEAIDRHVVHGHGKKIAFYWLGSKGEEEVYTFAEFQNQTNKF